MEQTQYAEAQYMPPMLREHGSERSHLAEDKNIKSTLLKSSEARTMLWVLFVSRLTVACVEKVPLRKVAMFRCAQLARMPPAHYNFYFNTWTRSGSLKHSITLTFVRGRHLREEGDATSYYLLRRPEYHFGFQLAPPTFSSIWIRTWVGIQVETSVQIWVSNLNSNLLCSYTCHLLTS